MKRKSYEPMTFTPVLIDFLVRRSKPFIEPHKSLNTMLAGAYMQGMADALEAFKRKELHE
ncbi:MAG: hypothetical protein D4R44_06890 [Actinobacteria bacterium]|nr:MAG: hypothetical protein D4R44_06890 [Actinomycetota bacterium]